MSNNILPIMIGVFSGFISGMSGMGSTILLLTLVYYFNVIGDYSTIKGTILYTLLFPVSMLSVYNYYKKGHVNIYIGTILVLSMIVGGYLGSKLILLLNKDSGDTISRRMGGIISIMCGIILLTK